uniref:Uncharacterized protein n=1 Tax=Ascaris lumbricoides TaxID=6252 RepID=A0A0M3IDA7_ASCLU
MLKFVRIPRSNSISTSNISDANVSRSTQQQVRFEICSSIEWFKPMIESSKRWSNMKMSSMNGNIDEILLLASRFYLLNNAEYCSYIR